MSPVSISLYILFLWYVLASVKRKFLLPNQRMGSSESVTEGYSQSYRMLSPYPFPLLMRDSR